MAGYSESSIYVAAEPEDYQGTYPGSGLLSTSAPANMIIDALGLGE